MIMVFATLFHIFHWCDRFVHVLKNLIMLHLLLCLGLDKLTVNGDVNLFNKVKD